MINIIIGAPGCGKTEKLIQLVEQYLEGGVRPDEIGFLAFTRKAANEAKQRAVIKFGIDEKELVYFRTIHSLAFRQLGLSKIQVIQQDHYKELGNKLGLNISGYINMEEGSINYGMSTGDRLIFIDGLARAKMIPLKQQWEQLPNEDIDWFELERVSRSLKKYKESNGLIDFTDMLEMFRIQGHIPKLKALFIDEAQDLSKLQWLVIKTLMDKTENIYIGADDLQAIFLWSGADLHYYLSLEGKVTVLEQSHRVPRKIQQLASQISDQIVEKRPFTWLPKNDEGNIIWHNDIDTVPLETGEWLLLTRNGYMLKQYEEHCLTSGFSFDGIRYSPLRSPALNAIRYYEDYRRGNPITPEQLVKINNYRRDKVKLIPGEMPIWHEALDRITPVEREYFIAARRHGETLINKPRIKLSTIHGVKGGEADNVLLMLDLAPRTYNEMQIDLDSELRVLYVAITRAKKELHILQPTTNMSFPI